MKQCSKERPSCWSRLKTFSKQAQAAQQIFQAWSLDRDICKLLCFALYVILAYLMKKCGSSGFQLYSAHSRTKLEILDYSTTCIQFVLNQRNCISEQNKTVFMPLQNVFCLVYIIFNLLKSLWWKIFSLSLFFFFSLKILCSSCYGILGNFSRWFWEHKYYFIGKVWVHQQSLTWQNCTSLLHCVRQSWSLNGLVSYHNKCGPCGELFTVCKKMRRSWVWTGEKGDVATSRILWVYVKQTAAVT